MAKFVQVWENTFVNADKIIRISKTEGRIHPTVEGKFQHKVLGSDGDFHWTGEYSSSIQYVLYTSQEWDGIYRVTNSEFFQGVEDLLK